MFKIIAVVAVAVVALVFAFTKVDPNLTPANQDNTSQVAEDSGDMSRIVIDGQIVHPGSYSISPSLTIGDLVEKAGGFLESADKDAILVETTLEGRSSVYIPAKSNYSTECEIEAAPEKININAASIEQLSTLDGISTVLAERIVKYREENGSFLALEDVKKVQGIGDATYQKIRDYIRLK